MGRRKLAVTLLSFAAAWAAEPAGKQAIDVLTEALNDGNAMNRQRAVSALQNAGLHPKAVQMVEGALKDKDVAVRQEAAVALGTMRSRRSISKLKAALEDEAPEVIFAAAQSLWNLGDRSGRDIFVAALSGERGDSSGMVKGGIRDAKRRLQNPSGLAMLGVKQGAGMLLGPFALGITVFEELTKDGGASARTLAAAALATDRDPSTIRSLETALIDKNWVVRGAAAKALADRRSRSSITHIQPLLFDQEEGARYMAAAAILRLQSGSSTRR